MLLKPGLAHPDIEYLTVALALLPPLLSTLPVRVPAVYFCAARLPLPQLAPQIDTPLTIAPRTKIALIGGDTFYSLPLIALGEDSLDELLSVKVGDRIRYLCTDNTQSHSPSVSHQDPVLIAGEARAKSKGTSSKGFRDDETSGCGAQEKRDMDRVLTVSRVFSSQNGKLVLLGRVSYLQRTCRGGGGGGDPTCVFCTRSHHAKEERWREEEKMVIVKLRLSSDESESWREHLNEFKMLKIVSGSKWHGMFPRLIGIGEIKVTATMAGLGHTRPLLLMSYISHPSITELLRNPLGLLRDDSTYGLGDKTVFHDDFALHRGLECAVTALQWLGLKHGDLKAGNVVYRVGTGDLGDPCTGEERDNDRGTRGRVWLIDMEGVAGLERGDGKKVEGLVEEILSDFWKYELCCASGKCLSGIAVALDVVVK